MPTAPVTAGDMVFVADRAGVVRALGADGTPRWKAFTGGADLLPARRGPRTPLRRLGRRARVRPGGRDRAAPVELPGRPGRAADPRLRQADLARGRWPAAWWSQDGMVYAAAGIAHYDGTYVVALDAVTGKVKWCNDTSGALSKAANCGVSLQGGLYVEDGELRFEGGGVQETARYDLRTGKCLNQPHEGVNSAFHTAFYAYYPDYGKYLSLDCGLPDGRSLCYDASYEGSRHSKLALLGPLPPGTQKPQKPVSRWGGPRRGPLPKPVWVDGSGRRFTSFVVGPGVLLAAGEAGSGDAQQAFLAAVRMQDGKDAWQAAPRGPGRQRRHRRRPRRSGLRLPGRRPSALLRRRGVSRAGVYAARGRRWLV